MRIEGIFSTTIDLLGKSVDLRVKNQNLISSNIANAETPNYVPQTLIFEEELQGALKSSQRGAGSGMNALRAVTGKVIETPSKTPGKDGNAVELENEMGKMAENQLMFNASVQMLTKKFEGLKSAIREGK
ncbi:MAG: flagellar basal body rod protein FlgB [Desulfuromonadales bacterium]